MASPCDLQPGPGQITGRRGGTSTSGQSHQASVNFPKDEHAPNRLRNGSRLTPHVERCARGHVPFEPRPVTIPGPGRSTAHPRQAVNESTNGQPHPYLRWRRATSGHERALQPTSNRDRWTALLFNLSPTRLRTLRCIWTPCHSRAINGGVHGTLQAARDRESRSAPSTHP
jgi:hypothetical protein